MDFLRSLNISGSGLTAQKLRMDVIAQNIANAEVTRGQDGIVYRRQTVVLSSICDRPNFKNSLLKTLENKTRGVQVDCVIEDTSPLKSLYDPDHPDANSDGYVMLPNVNKAQEMIDMLGTSRAYEANVTAFNATKLMILKALEIGR